MVVVRGSERSLTRLRRGRGGLQTDRQRFCVHDERRRRAKDQNVQKCVNRRDRGWTCISSILKLLSSSLICCASSGVRRLQVAGSARRS